MMKRIRKLFGGSSKKQKLDNDVLDHESVQSSLATAAIVSMLVLTMNCSIYIALIGDPGYNVDFQHLWWYKGFRHFAIDVMDQEDFNYTVTFGSEGTLDIRSYVLNWEKQQAVADCTEWDAWYGDCENSLANAHNRAIVTHLRNHFPMFKMVWWRKNNPEFKTNRQDTVIPYNHLSLVCSICAIMVSVATEFSLQWSPGIRTSQTKLRKWMMSMFPILVLDMGFTMVAVVACMASIGSWARDQTEWQMGHDDDRSWMAALVICIGPCTLWMFIRCLLTYYRIYRQHPQESAPAFMTWTPDVVATFLRHSNCSEFAMAMVEHKISGSLLPSMTMADIKCLGIHLLGPQLKLQALLADLVAGNIIVDSDMLRAESEERVNPVGDVGRPPTVLESDTTTVGKFASTVVVVK